MKTRKYKDSVYGWVDLIHIKTEVQEDENVRRTDEIWEYPTGDFRVTSTLEWLKVKTEPYVQEYFFKKSWMKAILQEKMGDRD